MTRRTLVPNILFGALAGALFLGIGARAAMYVFARATGRPPHITPRGALTVMFFGIAFGTGLGVVRWLVNPFLRGRWRLHGVSFAAIAYLICSIGMRPPTLLTYSLFAPLFLLYGVFLEQVLKDETAPVSTRSPL